MNDSCLSKGEQGLARVAAASSAHLPVIHMGPAAHTHGGPLLPTSPNPANQSAASGGRSDEIGNPFSRLRRVSLPVTGSSALAPIRRHDVNRHVPPSATNGMVRPN